MLLRGKETKVRVRQRNEIRRDKSGKQKRKRKRGISHDKERTFGFEDSFGLLFSSCAISVHG